MARKILIDAGHGGSDSGAVDDSDGMKEKDINLEVSLKVGAILKQNGCTVGYTRETDKYITLSDRKDMASSYDCIVSIHTNSATPDATGFEVLYNSSTSQNKLLATKILSAFETSTNLITRSRGLKIRNELKVLQASVPSALVELGFIENPDDKQALINDRQEFANQISRGILDFYGISHSIKPGVGSINGSGSTGSAGGNGSLSSFTPTGFSETEQQFNDRMAGLGGYNPRQNHRKAGKTGNPLVPWYKPTTMPPAYHDDTLPTHRATQGPYFLRIGDCQFFVPPLFISVTNPTPTERHLVLRQKESVQSGHGYSAKEINVTLWFNDIEQINGTPVASGVDGKIYYMDGLRSLIAQFKKTPFQPVINELLNDVHFIHAVTLVNISFNIVPNMPNTIQANLILKEFNATPYLGVPTVCYDSMICWPLFRWFYQQPLLDGDSLSKWKLPPVTTDVMTGDLKFRILPESYLESAQAAVDPSINKENQYNYIDKEWLYMEEANINYDDFVVNNISITVGQIVSDLQLANHQTPTHQFLGSLDTMISLHIRTQSRMVCTQFNEMINMVQNCTRKYKNKITTGYMGIENELINMCGVECVTLQNFNFSTVEGQPGLFDIQLDFLSYNKTQYEQEKPNGMAPHEVLDMDAITFAGAVGETGKGLEDFKNPIVLDGITEDLINELELYPDMQLPTYTVVNEVIKKINASRKAKGQLDLGIEFLESPYKKTSEKVVKEGSTQTTRREVFNYPLPASSKIQKWQKDADFKNSTIKNPISFMQKKLNELKGYKLSVTGILDTATIEAVKQVQKTGHSALKDGSINQVTWNLIVNFNTDPRVEFPEDIFLIVPGVRDTKYVPMLCQALRELGFYGGKDINTANSALQKAVKAFQTDTGFITPDGKVGYNTWGEIFTRYYQNETPPVTESVEYASSFFVDPDFYVFYPSPIALGIVDGESFQKFWDMMKAGGSGGMIHEDFYNATGIDLQHTVMQMLATFDGYGEDYDIPAKLALTEATQDMPIIAEKDHYKLMLHDMLAYSKRYTMCRAYPTALFLFIDEGKRVRGTRMWNNFYSYNSIVSIDIHKDRDNPIDTCEVTLSNIYHSLSTKPSYFDAAKKGYLSTIFIDIDDDMREQRAKIYQFMNIKPGCRIHVRIGYGSCPQALPVQFNGTIAELDSSPIMRIIAQSDGGELVNPIPAEQEDTNGFFKYGQSASKVISRIMTARNGWSGSFTWTGIGSGVGRFSDRSRYGIEHFGGVYAYDGVKADIDSLFHCGDQGKFSYDVTKNIYLGLPFVENTGNSRRTTAQNYTINEAREMNTYMYLYGKSPWDIFKTFSFCNSEYIVAATPHNLRSTLFFGQPCWPYKYNYKYTGGGSKEERLNINNYFESLKIYSQVHCIDSNLDIINNGIQVNGNITTAVIPVYTEGNTTKSDLIVYADRNIYPEYQKTEYYDASIMQDYLGPEFLYTAVGCSPSEKNARLAAISYLQHSFKDMYVGEIVIIGDPSIKPYDTLYIEDSYREIYGCTSVGSVSHSIGIDVGFITSIKPDLISYSQTKASISKARVMSMANIAALNYSSARSSFIATTSTLKAIEVFNERNRFVDDDDENFALATILKGTSAATMSALAVSTVSTGGVALVAVIGAGVGWYIADKMIEWYRNIFVGKDNNTITIMPLMHKDEPLIGGIKGHQTLIPGYTDVVEEKSLLQDETTSPEAMVSMSTELLLDNNKMIQSVQARSQKGLNVFNLEMNDTDYEAGQIYTDDGYMMDSSGKLIANPTTWQDYYAPNTAVGVSIVEIAKKYLGCSYVTAPAMNQKDVNGKFEFDCSSFVTHVFREAGIPLSSGRGSTKELWNKYNGNGGVIIDNDKDLLPGDLVFSFYADGTTGHVEIFIGDGKCIHAGNEATGVAYTNFTRKADSGYSYKKVIRVPELMTNTATHSSNTTPGSIGGQNYVHVFKNCVLTHYDDKGATIAEGVNCDAKGKYCAAHNMAVGTKIYVPALKGKVGNGVYIVADNGSPSFDFDINISGSATKYVNKDDNYDVYILEWGKGTMLWSFEAAKAFKVANGTYNEKAHMGYIHRFQTLNFVQPGRQKKLDPDYKNSELIPWK